MILNRDMSIDILRFIGLSLIILAHADPPFTLAQLRCFDVPLMIFISGLTASRKKIPSYLEYLIGRSKRLLIPVYIFITIYLLGLMIAQTIGVIPMYVDFQMVLDSYLLLGGIGYVWIIRVFLLMMLVTPLLVRFETYCKNNLLYAAICLLLLLLNDGISHLTSLWSSESFMNSFITEYLMYIIGYAPLFMLGLRLRYSSKKTMHYYVSFFVLVLLGSLFIYKELHDFPITITPRYKYPPQAYFLIYGALISVLLYYYKDEICKIISKLRISTFVAFVGQNTIWIYLWHIPFVLLTDQFVDNWILRYLLIYSVPLLIFWGQIHIVKKIGNSFIEKYFIG